MVFMEHQKKKWQESQIILDGQSSFSSLHAINASLDYFTTRRKLPNSSVEIVYLMK